MSDPGGPWASLRWPREEARKQAGRAPGFAASLRSVELCRSAAGRTAQTRQLLCLARPLSLGRVGAERGAASPRGDAAQQRPTAPPPPARRDARQSWRNALSHSHLPHPAQRGLGVPSPRETEPQAGGHGLGEGGSATPGARGPRLRSAPARFWRARSQGSCRTRVWRPPTAPDPSPAAEREASARVVATTLAATLGASSAAP